LSGKSRVEDRRNKCIDITPKKTQEMWQWCHFVASFTTYSACDKKSSIYR